MVAGVGVALLVLLLCEEQQLVLLPLFLKLSLELPRVFPLPQVLQLEVHGLRGRGEGGGNDGTVMV